MSGASEPKPARQHGLLRPSIAIPFLLVTLIWGSTWLVIKDQLGAAPPSWSVTWRFAVAALAMAVLALVKTGNLKMGRSAHLLAVPIGLTQFCFNFNFVYRAELYITSGMVAVLFGLLIVPNALLGRLILGTPVTRRFVAGSVIAIVGIALMLVPEAANLSSTSHLALGIGFTLLGILCASLANIMQAMPALRGENMLTLLAWAMFWGTAGNVAIAWVDAGPPALPALPGAARYWAGVVYLGLLGSVLTFPLYFGLIRRFGAGRAAYVGIAVPVVAMILSTVFEGYRWSGFAVGGALLSVAGMVVALRARSAGQGSAARAAASAANAAARPDT